MDNVTPILGLSLETLPSAEGDVSRGHGCVGDHPHVTHTKETNAANNAWLPPLPSAEARLP